jgi:hypothetical protein
MNLLDQAADEIERLRFDLQGIHSCHNDCTRDACVNRRLREKLRVAEEALEGLRNEALTANEAGYESLAVIHVSHRCTEALAKIRGEE